MVDKHKEGKEKSFTTETTEEPQSSQRRETKTQVRPRHLGTQGKERELLRKAHQSLQK